MNQRNIKPKQSKVNQLLSFYSLAFIFVGICTALDYIIPYLTSITPNVPKGRNHGFIYVPYNYETVDDKMIDTFLLMKYLHDCLQTNKRLKHSKLRIICGCFYRFIFPETLKTIEDLVCNPGIHWGEPGHDNLELNVP